MAKDEGKELTTEDREKLQKFLEHAPPEILDILEGLENEDSSTNVRVTSAFSRSFSGPLPPPEILQRYDEIETGFANRIVTLAEKEQSHRHDTEGTALASSIASEKRGQYLAFILCAMIVIGSIYLIADGAAISGLLLAGSTLTGLAYIFISGRNRSEAQTERENEAEE